MSTNDIFISYARQTEAAAQRLTLALRALGYGAWRDNELPPHRPYTEVIEERLRAARAVIVLWSVEAVGSQWVRAEADLARREGKLVQLRLDGAAPPLPFDQIQCLDFSRWRGGRTGPAWNKLIESLDELLARPLGETQAAPLAHGDPRRPPLMSRRTALLAAGGGVAVALPAAGWGVWRLTRSAGPPLLAIRPFQCPTPADAALVEGIWEDTRGAISTNPNLRVLGRTTVESAAARDLDASGFRSRFGVDYLLEGSVRREVARVRIDISLVRTSDGAGVWSSRFDSALDDIFALQSRIAGEIEGRIRGRLAPGEGRKPQSIATSGEVYSLYTEARAKIRERGDDLDTAAGLLRRAVALDPNYAPAWAALAVAGCLTLKRDGAPDGAEDMARAKAVEDARQALELAPNLSLAWSAFAFTQDNYGDNAQQALRRAVALDPGNAEAWMWLGSALAQENRQREAVQFYARAAEIEPLWRPAVYNLIGSLDTLGRRSEADAEIERLRRTGDERLFSFLRSIVLFDRGDVSGAAHTVMALRKTLSPGQRRSVDDYLAGLLCALGEYREAAKIRLADPVFLAAVDGHPASAAGLMPPSGRMIDFWFDAGFAILQTRLLTAAGRAKEVAARYHASASSARALFDIIKPNNFIPLASPLALALRAAGEPAESQAVISVADDLMTRYAHNGPLPPALLLPRAQLRAVAGRTAEALSDLNAAYAGPFLPDNFQYSADPAADPAFAALLPDPAFQAIRRRVLDHIARERAKLGPVEL